MTRKHTHPPGGVRNGNRDPKRGMSAHVPFFLRLSITQGDQGESSLRVRVVRPILHAQSHPIPASEPFAFRSKGKRGGKQSQKQVVEICTGHTLFAAESSSRDVRMFKGQKLSLLIPTSKRACPLVMQKKKKTCASADKSSTRHIPEKHRLRSLLLKRGPVEGKNRFKRRIRQTPNFKNQEEDSAQKTQAPGNAAWAFLQRAQLFPPITRLDHKTVQQGPVPQMAVAQAGTPNWAARSANKKQPGSKFLRFAKNTQIWVVFGMETWTKTFSSSCPGALTQTPGPVPRDFSEVQWYRPFRFRDEAEGDASGFVPKTGETNPRPPAVCAKLWKTQLVFLSGCRVFKGKIIGEKHHLRDPVPRFKTKKPSRAVGISGREPGVANSGQSESFWAVLCFLKHLVMSDVFDARVL